MHAQIHARKAHRRGKQHAYGRNGPPARPHGQHAKHDHRGLRMSAGKGVACRAGARGLHDGEGGIDHPWPRDEEHRLQELIEHGTREPRKQQAKAPALVEAPGQREAREHEEGFLAQKGHQRGHLIPKRRAYGFQSL